MKTRVIIEGATKLAIPDVALKRGPGTKKMDVFYNPTMTFNRDISVLVVRQLVKESKERFLDGLAATGARGVRIANEASGDYEIRINDWNDDAFKLIKRNIKLNKLAHAEASHANLKTVLAQQHWDYIDVDPFGSPIEFIDPAIQALRNKGILAITATDTAPLCGTYPKTCQRRYDALSLKTEFCHETATRILAGVCVRNAARYDIALRPILAHALDHYVRLYLRAERGAKKTEASMALMGYANYDEATGERWTGDIESQQFAGPLWIGELYDATFLKKLKLKGPLSEEARVGKMLDIWKGEAKAPALFYTVDEVAHRAKTSPPKMDALLDALRKKGFVACRTHFSPTGFKTDAGVEELVKLVKKLD